MFNIRLAAVLLPLLLFWSPVPAADDIGGWMGDLQEQADQRERDRQRKRREDWERDTDYGRYPDCEFCNLTGPPKTTLPP